MITMPDVKATTPEQDKILRDNHMDPGQYGVKGADETYIRLLCYDTRCDIVIHKGDRPWL